LENNQQTVHCRITVESPAKAFQLLAEVSGLPKERIKHAMVKGAVWLHRPGNKERRLRKAKFKLQEGDRLELCYDSKVLAMAPPHTTCIAENSDYSVWVKPPWMLSQGTRYGDHCSLLRIAEKSNRDIDYKLIHRLDREASGLMLLAHNRNAAKLLSNLFQENKIEKRYFAEVEGILKIKKEGLLLTEELDEKPAKTEILTSRAAKSRKNSLLDIRLHTGRLHQIRRHLSGLGYPVLGDPQYGNAEGKVYAELHLCAWHISFLSPFTKKKCVYQIPDDLRPSFLM
jgi:23S rRNA-/tRNA-specific pseudouridylate synthase